MNLCEVCGRPALRSRKTGLCALCRTAGALFRRRWSTDLRKRGHTFAEIREITGSTESSPKLWGEATLR